MTVDALACVFAGAVGTTTSGAYIESAAGIREGARTGLVNLEALSDEEIAQLQRYEFRHSQPAGIGQMQHRAIAGAKACPGIRGIEQSLDLCPVEVVDQRLVGQEVLTEALAGDVRLDARPQRPVSPAIRGPRRRPCCAGP